MRKLVAPLSAAALLAAAHAAAQETHLKPGLWEMKMAVAGQGEAMTMQTCVGPQTSPMKGAQGDRGGRCEKETSRRDGDRWVFEAVCKDGRHTITTKGTVTGRLDSQYRVDVNSRYEPPMDGRREDAMTMNMRLLGPCKPGMKPGDMAMEGMPAMPGMRPPQ